MSPGEKFQYFMNTSFATNRTPEYWVNWDKVIGNTYNHELNLNTLNYLVGKKNIYKETFQLISQQPQLLKTIPILFASRDFKLDVLKMENSGMSYYSLDFENPDLKQIDKYVKFMSDSGLLNFLENHANKSLVDFVFGVETGLDSNGRKNRSGTQNEIILEETLKQVVENKNWEFGTQETAKSILSKWNITIPERLEEDSRGGRRYDGVIYNFDEKTITIIETNFYGGGGSKLKAVAGEFTDLYNTNFKNSKNINFVWISDGPGWDTAKNPMREAFDDIPYILNLGMVNQGMLSEIIAKNNC
jgi:type II restriction enzyme